VISNLQILRGLAALGVVFYHTDFRLPGDWHTEFFGVSTFFVISGFIMCFITRDPDGGDATARSFMIRRLIRIVPLYWLCTLALVLWNRGFLHDMPHVLKSLIFYPSETFPVLTFPVLGVGWTLNFEIYFYVVFALAILISRNLAPLIAAGIIYAVIKANDLGVDNWLIKFYSHSYIHFFLFGIVLFYVWHFYRTYRSKPLIVACALAVVVIYGSEFIQPQQSFYSQTYVDFPVALVAAAIFAASAGADITWRPLVLLGDASYAIYLTHTFTLETFRRMMPIWKESLWSTLLVMVIATTVGILVHLFVERPMLRFIRNGFRVRRVLAHINEPGAAGADTRPSAAVTQ
jgi:exopolysaccharide production protein ExoZ